MSRRVKPCIGQDVVDCGEQVIELFLGGDGRGRIAAEGNVGRADKRPFQKRQDEHRPAVAGFGVNRVARRAAPASRGWNVSKWLPLVPAHQLPRRQPAAGCSVRSTQAPVALMMAAGSIDGQSVPRLMPVRVAESQRSGHPRRASPGCR